MFRTKRNKKGFTLIELMAVIAIIAVLVSVVVPTVNRATTKANAATNAANMRAIKGQVSTMLLQGQITYKTSEQTNRVIQYIDDMIEDVPDEMEWLKAILTGGKELISTVGSVAEHYNNTYYAEEGKVDIDGTTLTAPGAKAIKIDDLTLRKDTQMTITVGNEEIIVTYGGMTIDTMALIAQYGDATEIDWSETEHTYIDSNGDSICDVCNRHSMQHGILGSDTVGDNLDNALSGAHRCSNEKHDSHFCADPNCGLRIDCYDGPDADHKCDFPEICGNNRTISRCEDSANDGDHSCDQCGKQNISDCVDSNKDCKCDETQCGKAMHVDSDNNYKCDNNGCTYVFEHTCVDNSKIDGKCDYCGKDKDHVHTKGNGNTCIGNGCGAVYTSVVCHGTTPCEGYDKKAPIYSSDTTCTCGHPRSDHPRTGTISWGACTKVISEQWVEADK